MISLQMFSLDLDMKLVFSSKGSTDINGTPYENDPPELQKVRYIVKLTFNLLTAKL